MLNVNIRIDPAAQSFTYGYDVIAEVSDLGGRT